jgi:hypothetical protein
MQFGIHYSSTSSGIGGEMSNFYLNLGYDHSYYSSMTSCIQVIGWNLVVKIRSRGQYLNLYQSVPILW